MLVSLDELLALLLTYRYAVLFPAAVVEGPMVMILTGFLASLGYFQLASVYAALVVGDLVGDSLYYALGRWGRWQFIDRWGKYVGVTRERTIALDDHFAQHSGKTLALGKLTHAVGAVILVAAGASGVPYRKFLWFNFLATLPKTLLLLLLGFYFGQAYRQFSHYLGYTALGMIIVLLLGLWLYAGLGRRITKRV